MATDILDRYIKVRCHAIWLGENGRDEDAERAHQEAERLARQYNEATGRPHHVFQPAVDEQDFYQMAA